VTYELDDVDRRTVRLIQHALMNYDRGNPIRDYIDEDDQIEAFRLLMEIVTEKPLPGNRWKPRAAKRRKFRQ
jgi:hypothetical protein